MTPVRSPMLPPSWRCDWHTVNKAVLAWGEALLDADCDRVSVEALGLDETHVRL